MAISLLTMSGLTFHSALGAQHRSYDELMRDFDAQEKHIDSVDKVAQDNKDKLQGLLIRIEGDEDFVKGGAYLLGFLVSVGAFTYYRKKAA
jgi:hypothetical protein